MLSEDAVDDRYLVEWQSFSSSAGELGEEWRSCAQWLCSVAVWMICLAVEGLLLFNPPSATGGGRAVE